MSGILQTLIASIGRAITDTYFNLVTLLLPGNGTNGAQNNTFLDSSTNNFTITRNGNTTQGTFSPFSQTGWSNYFDGSSNLNLSTQAVLNVGTGNFTFECFAYFPNVSSLYSRNMIFGTSESTEANGIQIRLSGATQGAGGLLIRMNTTDIINYTTAIAHNTWNHIAVVREGTGSNQVKLYVNGTNVASGTSSGNLSTPNYNIGRLQATNSTFDDYYTGYLSDIRITNTAIYTAAFTPPTIPLTAVSGTSLLTCQSNRFIDNSSNAFAITVNGTPSVQAFSPFAPTAAYSAAAVGGSGYFDGTGDFLSVADNTGLRLGTSAFTIQAWIYRSVAGTAHSIIAKGGASTGFVLQVTSTNVLRFTHTTTNVDTTTTIPAGAWTHVAAVRTNTGTNGFQLYINGVSSVTATVATDFNQTDTLYVGADRSAATTMNGYISGLKYTNGTAESISVPTSPPTATTNVALLTNFTNAGITDATAKNDLETVGNAQISTTQSKFGGSSMYFDGTGDLLALPNNELFNLSSGDFTIEGWFYANSTTSNGALVSKMNYNGTNWTGFAVFQFNQTIVFYHANAGSINNITTGNVITSTGTWYHIAVVKSGTATNNTKIYIDGVQQAQGTPSIGNASKPLTVGGTNSTYGWDTARELNCYIDDLRITRYARYTSAFTPPTAPFALQ